MILSKREKYIALTALAAILLVSADRLILTPWLEHRRLAQQEQETMLDLLERGRLLISRRRQFSENWGEVLGSSLPESQGQAESQILHALRNWAQEATMPLTSIRPERLVEHEDMRELVFLVVGGGSMEKIAKFIWLLESSNLPVRVTEMQMTARTDGHDDLTVQLKISTLFMAGTVRNKQDAIAR